MIRKNKFFFQNWKLNPSKGGCRRAETVFWKIISKWILVHELCTDKCMLFLSHNIECYTVHKTHDVDSILYTVKNPLKFCVNFVFIVSTYLYVDISFIDKIFEWIQIWVVFFFSNIQFSTVCILFTWIVSSMTEKSNVRCSSEFVQKTIVLHIFNRIMTLYSSQPSILAILILNPIYHCTPVNFCSFFLKKKKKLGS